MASSKYKVVKATLDDVSAMEDVLREGFANDVVTISLNGTTDPEVIRERHEKSHVDGFTYSHLTGTRTLLAVEKASGKAVGLAQYELPTRLDEAGKAEKEAMLAAMKAEPLPEGSNPSFQAGFFGTIDEYKEKHSDSETDICTFMPSCCCRLGQLHGPKVCMGIGRMLTCDSSDLTLLCTIPTHNRQGVASMLLVELMAEAERLNARIFLVASPMGLPLYLRHGWKVVDRFTFDPKDHGLTADAFVGTCIIREPRPREKGHVDV